MKFYLIGSQACMFLGSTQIIRTYLPFLKSGQTQVPHSGCARTRYSSDSARIRQGGAPGGFHCQHIRTLRTWNSVNCSATGTRHEDLHHRPERHSGSGDRWKNIPRGYRARRYAKSGSGKVRDKEEQSSPVGSRSLFYLIAFQVGLEGGRGNLMIEGQSGKGGADF